ncbi:LETM1-like protein-domain-containing protein [Pisolithus marmoratus]|nr:LETM1-like protein-domain-containing protein [Pisolithus marmoratus]
MSTLLVIGNDTWGSVRMGKVPEVRDPLYGTARCRVNSLPDASTVLFDKEIRGAKAILSVGARAPTNLRTAADVEWGFTRIRIRRICCLHLRRSYGSVVVVGRPIWNNRTNVRVAIGRAVQQRHPHSHFLSLIDAIGTGQLIAAGLRAGDSIEIRRFVEKETQMSKGDVKVFTSRFMHYTDTKIQGLHPHAVQATDRHNIRGIMISGWSDDLGRQVTPSHLALPRVKQPMIHLRHSIVSSAVFIRFSGDFLQASRVLKHDQNYCAWLSTTLQDEAIVLLSSRSRALLHTSAFRRPAAAIARSPVFLVARRSDDLRNVPRTFAIVRLESTSTGTGGGAAAVANTTAPSSSSEQPKPLPPTPKEDAPLLTRVWKKVKHEAQHYWHGSKLLVSGVRISARLQWKILHGESLTRRERRQLKRTMQDLLRLIPFCVFLIVPFMELLLPVALKLFPNMLPSTFEDKFAAEEKQRKLLRVRLEMAKFLQETLRESGLRANAHIVGSDAFKEFFRKLFDDDLTLDNFHAHNSYPRAVTWAPTHSGRTISLGALYARGSGISVGTIKQSMLKAACQSRGIRTSGVSPARLRDELSTWINLHLHNRVSGVLLILGRAFNFDRTYGVDEDGKTAVIKCLESVMSGLPDNLVDSDKASYKQKLEVLQQQEELIEDEAEQEQKGEDARRAKRESQEQEIRTAHSLLPDAELHPEVAPTTENARMTTEQLNGLGEALCVLSAKSSVLKERRDELRTLMEENLQGDEDPKSPSIGALTKRIRTMLTKIDAQLQDYDARMGRIPVEDLEKALTVIKHRPDDEVIQAVIQKPDVDQDGYVELEHVLGLIKEDGLGIEVDDEARTIIVQGKEIRMDSRPREEDIVQE